MIDEELKLKKLAIIEASIQSEYYARMWKNVNYRKDVENVIRLVKPLLSERNYVNDSMILERTVWNTVLSSSSAKFSLPNNLYTINERRSALYYACKGKFTRSGLVRRFGIPRCTLYDDQEKVAEL